MRRLPARTVLILSLALALICLVAAVWLVFVAPWWVALLLFALAVWFGVDGYRAWTWTRAP